MNRLLRAMNRVNPSRQDAQPILAALERGGYHPKLVGSVAAEGHSLHDIDLVLPVNMKNRRATEKEFERVKLIMDGLGFDLIAGSDWDDKIVYDNYQRGSLSVDIFYTDQDHSVPFDEQEFRRMKPARGEPNPYFRLSKIKGGRYMPGGGRWIETSEKYPETPFGETKFHDKRGYLVEGMVEVEKDSPDQPATASHEISHHVLKQTVNQLDPVSEFSNELEAWYKALARGVRFNPNYVYECLFSYIKGLPTLEMWQQALRATVRLLNQHRSRWTVAFTPPRLNFEPRTGTPNPIKHEGKLECALGNMKIAKDTLMMNITSAKNCPAKKLGMCQVPDNKCYALLAEKRYPDAYTKKGKLRKGKLTFDERQTRIWDAVSAEEIAQSVERLVERSIKNRWKGGRIRYVRFMEAGDFRDQRDVDKMSRVAELLDGIARCYTYTARRDLDYSHISSNLIINGSGHMVSNEYRVVTDMSKWLPVSYDRKRGVVVNCPCGIREATIRDCAKCGYCKTGGHKIIQQRLIDPAVERAARRRSKKKPEGGWSRTLADNPLTKALPPADDDPNSRQLHGSIDPDKPSITRYLPKQERLVDEIRRDVTWADLRGGGYTDPSTGARCYLDPNDLSIYLVEFNDTLAEAYNQREAVHLLSYIRKHRRFPGDVSVF